MNERRSRGGTIAFIAALSGLLTAVAAVLHSAGAFTGVAAPHSDLMSSRNMTTKVSPAPSQPPSISATSAAVSVQLNPSAQIQARIVQGTGSDPLISQCAAGVTSACASLLSDLIEGCENNSLKSCDVLYIVSPAGSTLSTWASTCGGRYSDESMAGRCAE